MFQGVSFIVRPDFFYLDGHGWLHIWPAMPAPPSHRSRKTLQRAKNHAHRSDSNVRIEATNQHTCGEENYHMWWRKLVVVFFTAEGKRRSTLDREPCNDDNRHGWGFSTVRRFTVLRFHDFTVGCHSLVVVVVVAVVVVVSVSIKEPVFGHHKCFNPNSRCNFTLQTSRFWVTLQASEHSWIAWTYYIRNSWHKTSAMLRFRVLPGSFFAQLCAIMVSVWRKGGRLPRPDVQSSVRRYVTVPPLKLRRTPCTGNAVYFFCATIPKFCLATWWICWSSSAAKLHNPCVLLKRLLIDIMPVQQTLVPCPAFHSRVVWETLFASPDSRAAPNQAPTEYFDRVLPTDLPCSTTVPCRSNCPTCAAVLVAASMQTASSIVSHGSSRKNTLTTVFFFNATPKVVFAASFLHARSLWRFAARSCKDPSSAMLQQTYGHFAARWLAAVFFFRAAAGGSALTICRMLSRFTGPICFSRTTLHALLGLRTLFRCVFFCMPGFAFLSSFIQRFDFCWRQVSSGFKPSSENFTFSLVLLHKLHRQNFALLGSVPSAFTSCLAWCSWSLNPGSANKSPVLKASSSLPSVSSLACCYKMHLSIFNALIKRLG